MKADNVFAANVGRYSPCRLALYELFKQSPEAALEKVLADGEDTIYGVSHFWTSVKDKDGMTYGSYKCVKRADLKDRIYKIGFVNDMISILYLDVVYNPRTFKSEPIAIL